MQCTPIELLTSVENCILDLLMTVANMRRGTRRVPDQVLCEVQSSGILNSRIGYVHAIMGSRITVHPFTDLAAVTQRRRCNLMAAFLFRSLDLLRTYQDYTYN